MKIFFLLLLFSLPALAQESRWIDIEWEEVAGAANYEVELFEGSDGKLTPRGKYKVENSTWSNAVPPGKYSLRIRSLDKRGVPGEWSDYIPVKVRMHNPKLFQPGPGSQVSTAQVDFEWSEGEGAAIVHVALADQHQVHLAHQLVLQADLHLRLGHLGQRADGRLPGRLAGAGHRPVGRAGGQRSDR